MRKNYNKFERKIMKKGSRDKCIRNLLIKFQRIGLRMMRVGVAVQGNLEKEVFWLVTTWHNKKK